MTRDILFALWFFIPAGIANSTPIVVAHIPGLNTLNAPMDFGKKFHKKRIFGEHKTWRGFIAGMVMAVLVIWLQVGLFDHYAWIRHISQPVFYSGGSIVALGLLLGFGALIGDATESFLKRQYNIDSGQRWFPFDQLDYVIGGLLFATAYVRLPVQDYGWIIIIWFCMHLIFSYIGYILKLKDKPL